MKAQMQMIDAFQYGEPVPMSAYRRQVLRSFDAQQRILDSHHETSRFPALRTVYVLNCFHAPAICPIYNWGAVSLLKKKFARRKVVYAD
jgi:hypothetical protein